MSGRIAWRFYDAVLDETLFLAVNPNKDNGSHGIAKTTKYESPASNYVDSAGVLRIGDVVAQDAPNEQQKFSYSGFVYTKQEYDDLQRWCNKEHPWQVRDDLSREYLIYVERLEMQRVWVRHHRWKHSYNFSGLVLEEL